MMFSEPPREQIQPGQRVAGGRYVLLDVLGRGGLATVFRARDMIEKSSVALKVLRDRYVGRPERAERLRREFEYAQRIEHPAIIEVFEQGELEDGRPYFSMELIDGEPLSQLLVGSGGFGFERAHRVTRALAVALRAVHEAGVVHRDVKPANVLVLEGDRIKLIDFGMAGDHDAPAVPVGHSGRLTRANDLLGTCEYMAPEQVLRQPPQRSMDVFALGVVMYELLATITPYSGMRMREYVELQQQGDPLLRSAERWCRIQGAPEEFGELIDACRRRDPAERPQGMDEVIWRLDALLGESVDAADERPCEVSGAEGRTGEHRGGAGPTPPGANRPAIDPGRGGGADEAKELPANVPEAESPLPIAAGIVVRPERVAEPEESSQCSVHMPPVLSVPTAVERARTGVHGKDRAPRWRRPAVWFAAATVVVAAGWSLSNTATNPMTAVSTAEIDGSEARPVSSVAVSTRRDLPEASTAVHSVNPPVQVEAEESAPAQIEAEAEAAAPVHHPVEGKQIESAERPESPTGDRSARHSKPGQANPSASVEPEPEPEPCEGEVKAARAAAKAGQWRRVLRFTKNVRCWPPNAVAERTKLRTWALYETERYVECAKEGRGSTDDNVTRWTSICEFRVQQEQLP